MTERDPVARLIAAWNEDGVHVHRGLYSRDFGYLVYRRLRSCAEPGRCVRVRLTKMVPAPEEEAQPLSEGTDR